MRPEMPIRSARIFWRWSIMNGRAFKLGTFAKPDGKPFAAIVLDDSAIDLAQAAAAAGKKLATASGTPNPSIQDLLDSWEANFATLQEIVAFLAKESAKSGATPLKGLTPRPPVARP